MLIIARPALFATDGDESPYYNPCSLFSNRLKQFSVKALEFTASEEVGVGKPRLSVLGMAS